jgi:penicillin amidase
VLKHPPHIAVLLIIAAAGLALTSQDEVASLRAKARSALSQTEGEHRVAGIEQPVEVIRDQWGVPHIYAKTVADLFFAQGYVAAQDRLWQLDLWRRIAEGRLSEILGPAGVTRDTFARLLRYRGDMDAEWQAYGPGAKGIIEAFAGGINARIDEVLADPAALPIEFQLTGSRPDRWTPDVIVGRMAGFIMTRNARSEVQRAKLARSVGAARVAEFMPTDPPAPTVVPDGLDLGDITDDILALANGAGETVSFASLSTQQAPRPGQRLFGFVRAASSRSQLEAAMIRAPADEAAAIGSNDWVVSGALTVSGRPLLANDPHRTLMLPSLRYTVHLNGPGWNVIGAGEPALPGVAAGHNDRIAFGFTIVGIDQQDLYVEHLNAENPTRYSYRGAWEPIRVEQEQLLVRGEQPREIELRFTRHGPVLHVDAARRRAYALRWVGTEPGAAGYLRSLVIDAARNWREFRSALDGWKVPSENLVYADEDGNIGWMAAGLAPVRPNWNGLLPVPGQEGKYEWDGFLKASELPQLFNPRSGLIATANHNILPPRYGKGLGYEFSAPYRFARIIEVLERGRRQGERFTVADVERLQHDETSVVAQIVCEALRQALADRSSTGTRPPSAAAEQAARMLTTWNGVLGKDSAAAALYEMWLPKLATSFRDAVIAPEDRVHAGDRMTTERLLGLLTAASLARVDLQPGFAAWVDGSPRAPWAAVAARRRLAPETRRRAIDVLTGSALEEAWREATARMGPDPAGWAWGRIHRAAFEHPLAFTAARSEVMSLGDVPRGGDATTPNATGSGPRQTSGASYREVLDLSDWDRSVTINVPGLSGQPESPHYGDLLPLWADGRYHPLPFSREAVERYAAERLRLVPAR